MDWYRISLVLVTWSSATAAIKSPNTCRVKCTLDLAVNKRTNNQLKTRLKLHEIWLFGERISSALGWLFLNKRSFDQTHLYLQLFAAWVAIWLSFYSKQCRVKIKNGLTAGLQSRIRGCRWYSPLSCNCLFSANPGVSTTLLNGCLTLCINLWWFCDRTSHS